MIIIMITSSPQQQRRLWAPGRGEGFSGFPPGLNIKKILPGYAVIKHCQKHYGARRWLLWQVLHILHFLHILHNLHILHILHILHNLSIMHILHILHIVHVLQIFTFCIFCIYCICCIFCIFCLFCIPCTFCIFCIFPNICINLGLSILVSKGQLIPFSRRSWHQIPKIRKSVR